MKTQTNNKTHRPEILKESVQCELMEIDEDIKAGRNISGPFYTAEEFMADFLVKDNKRTTSRSKRK